MDDRQFRLLLNALGFSWAGFRKVRKGVKKRISRHMNQLGCRNMAAYLSALDGNPESRQACELLMTVSITRFFRDREFWRTLEEKLLPGLVTMHPEKLKVWSAGCACGDEVYSFKIVWECLKKRLVKLPELELLASDMNPAYLDRARAGIFSAGSLKELNDELRTKYFVPQPGTKHYKVKDALGRDVVWQCRHLLSTPPGSDFNIIFLRNSILTYYEQPLKQKAFENVVQQLSPAGLLIIGSHESLPLGTTHLVCVEPHPFVYRKHI
ncbi:MAG: hypothetical protein KJ687_04595 [Proteobacteria bacterium]|nr:hypothetical protein [Pseudomonadota bacterium]